MPFLIPFILFPFTTFISVKYRISPCIKFLFYRVVGNHPPSHSLSLSLSYLAHSAHFLSHSLYLSLSLSPFSLTFSHLYIIKRDFFLFMKQSYSLSLIKPGLFSQINFVGELENRKRGKNFEYFLAL